jgi:hypothetical protein
MDEHLYLENCGMVEQKMVRFWGASEAIVYQMGHAFIINHHLIDRFLFKNTVHRIITTILVPSGNLT